MYAPGDDAHKLSKAAGLAVDCACLDLEDGVAPNRKDAARAETAAALRSLDFGVSEKLVRINALDTPHWKEDVRVSVAAGIEGIRIAKCESAQDVRTVVEHIEQAGVHSGDSACSLPPYSLSKDITDELRRQTKLMAKALNVCGLMNVQFAIKDDVVYVLEVNPRASRTVPFVSKATGLQLAKIAARCMAGKSLKSQGVTAEVVPPYFSVKEAVFPFVKFPGVDTILGPEMKSTGEVMGVGRNFAEAFVKSQLAAGVKLPSSGKVFLSVKEGDKPKAVEIARHLANAGFSVIATRGTAAAIDAAGIPVQAVNKVTEGRPHIVDMIKNNEIALIINTVDEKRQAINDSRSIRTSGLQARVTMYTTIWGAEAAAEGITSGGDLVVYPIQTLHSELQ